jgi:predicted Fe-Mo cluster-binding NifX family protein
MAQKVLIPLNGNDVASRFDLATEVLIAVGGGVGVKTKEKIVVLSESSSEKLCQLILAEGIDTVICNGIEEEHYQYLTWKRVQVLDSVMGSWKSVLKRFYEGTLKPGEILYKDTD